VDPLRKCQRTVGVGPPTFADGPHGCHRRWLSASAAASGDGAPLKPPSPAARLGPRSPVRVPFPVRRRRSPVRSSSLRDDDGPPSGRRRSPPCRPRPRAAVRGVRKAQSVKRKNLYRTDAGSSTPPTATARFGTPLPCDVPPFPLLLTLPLAAHVQPPLVLGRPAPHAVHLMRRERVLQALPPHLAGGTDRLRPGYLPGARPARRHGEEQLRIRLPAGGQLPPVAPLLLKRGTLGW
jgi:hypothetical protein